MAKPATCSFLFGASIVFSFLLLASSTDGKKRQLNCHKKNVVAIVQGDGPPQFNGIPTYIVQITNQCYTGCAVADLHLRCGWFSSAKFINPRLFKRVAFDDCLVNNGRPLPYGHTISFQYATTYKFPFSVSSLKCIPE